MSICVLATDIQTNPCVGKRCSIFEKDFPPNSHPRLHRDDCVFNVHPRSDCKHDFLAIGERIIGDSAYPNGQHLDIRLKIGVLHAKAAGDECLQTICLKRLREERGYLVFAHFLQVVGKACGDIMRERAKVNSPGWNTRDGKPSRCIGASPTQAWIVIWEKG